MAQVTNTLNTQNTLGRKAKVTLPSSRTHSVRVTESYEDVPY